MNKKKLTSLVIPLLATATVSFSGNTSKWASLNLSKDEISSSINFQLSRGSTCINEFNQLNSTLNRLLKKGCSKLDVEYILGNPDFVNENKFGYTLTSDAKSIAHFIFKDNKLSNFQFVKK